MSIEKVTCFVTRRIDDQDHFALLKHPYAGNQVPAGTVEEGESFVDAAIREAGEETGLDALQIVAEWSSERNETPRGKAFILKTSTIYARPDLQSFDWVTMPRGVIVDTLESRDGFVQIDYTEPEALGFKKMSFRVTGWVRQDDLTTTVDRRHFHLAYTGDTKRREWEVNVDHHLFTLAWHPIAEDPNLQEPFDGWYKSFRKYLTGGLESASTDTPSL